MHLRIDHSGMESRTGGRSVIKYHGFLFISDIMTCRKRRDTLDPAVNCTAMRHAPSNPILKSFSRRWISMAESCTFLSLSEDYIGTFLPVGRGASPNTIKSYKYAFRLLIEYMFSEKQILPTGYLFQIWIIRHCWHSLTGSQLQGGAVLQPGIKDLQPWHLFLNTPRIGILMQPPCSGAAL